MQPVIVGGSSVHFWTVSVTIQRVGKRHVTKLRPLKNIKNVKFFEYVSAYVHHTKLFGVYKKE